MKKIFISHSEKDKEIVKYFTDDILIGCLGFHHTDIFCTSLDGMKIESGKYWRDQIKQNLVDAKIVFLIITPNYKSSEMCQNELGAVWILEKEVLPVIVEPINYSSVGILQEVNQIEKLLDEKCLDRIKDIVENIFSDSIRKAKTDRWTDKKREFITKTKLYIKKHPFELPVSKDEFEKLSQEYTALTESYENIVQEKSQLENAVEDLRKTKGNQVVNNSLKKHGLKNDLDEFNETVSEVKKNLEKVSPVIRTLVFNGYTGRDLRIDYQTYAAEIEKAIARSQINEDMQILWNSKTMNDICHSLDSLEESLKRLSSDSMEELDEKYNVELHIKNLDFWKNIINTTLYYE